MANKKTRNKRPPKKKEVIEASPAAELVMPVQSATRPKDRPKPRPVRPPQAPEKLKIPDSRTSSVGATQDNDELEAAHALSHLRDSAAARPKLSTSTTQDTTAGNTATQTTLSISDDSLSEDEANEAASVDELDEDGRGGDESDDGGMPVYPDPQWEFELEPDDDKEVPNNALARIADRMMSKPFEKMLKCE